ncbi:hypothetical protein [Nocardia sp. NPDC050793]|uniref:hypothetical protein n=1 Tax=Nocardia sp. NPDC050793 TaxID=3155159 RepID=UPI0033E23D03
MKGQGRGNKPHLEVGPLVVTCEVLMPVQDPDQRIIYRAADSGSRMTLNRLSAGIAAAGRRPWSRTLGPSS